MSFVSNIRLRRYFVISLPIQNILRKIAKFVGGVVIGWKISNGREASSRELFSWCTFRVHSSHSVGEYDWRRS